MRWWMKRSSSSARNAKASELRGKPAHDMTDIFERLGLGSENPGAFCGEWLGGGEMHEKISPVDGKSLGKFRMASAQDYERVIACAQEGFEKWRSTPAPVRGETVRQLGNALRDHKE